MPINDEYKEYDDWSKFKADSHINALMKQDSAPNRTSEDFSRLSKIKAANDALRAKIYDQREQYQASPGSKRFSASKRDVFDRAKAEASSFQEYSNIGAIIEEGADHNQDN